MSIELGLPFAPVLWCRNVLKSVCVGGEVPSHKTTGGGGGGGGVPSNFMGGDHCQNSHPYQSLREVRLVMWGGGGGGGGMQCYRL